MFTPELASEYLGTLLGAYGIGWALGYVVRSLERLFDLL